MNWLNFYPFPYLFGSIETGSNKEANDIIHPRQYYIENSSMLSIFHIQLHRGRDCFARLSLVGKLIRWGITTRGRMKLNVENAPGFHCFIYVVQEHQTHIE